MMAPGMAMRLGAIAFIFAAACALYWSGVGENDSFRYIEGALSWLENGPTLGDTHWTLRAPMIAPMAASFALFGSTEFAATAPNLAYAGLLVVATYLFSQRYWGAFTATSVSLVTATSAFLVGMQIEVSATGAELFFGVVACWLFVDGLSGRSSRYAFAGLFAGAAWLCRETNAYLPIAFLAVLGLQRPLPAGAILRTLAPICAIIAAEMAFYAVAAGNPLYRYQTDLGHRGEGGVYADLQSNGPAFFEWLVRPIFYFFSDPAATPAFLFGGAALLSRDVRSALFKGEAALAGRTFAFATVISFLLSSYVLNVKWPSYYAIAAYAAGIAIGVFIAMLAKRRGAAWGIAGFAAWCVINLAADDFRAYGEIEEARRLVAHVAATDQTVISDHVTAGRARIFLRMRGLDPSKVRSSLEEGLLCGAVYVAHPVERSLAIQADPTWRPVWIAPARSRRITHMLIAHSGLAALSPRLSEIVAPPKPVTLFNARPCDPSS
jgi:4-amino-4-deoxy-L-arabinose transferase-like glycosyltransferase